MSIRFASIFKRLRVQAGYSQKEEAEKLTALGAYTNNAHVSRWENGSNNPTLEQFMAICALYHIHNVRTYFGDLIMDSLTANLNDRGVEKLLEMHDVLIEDPRFTVNAGNFGPNTFALNYDDNQGNPGEDEISKEPAEDDSVPKVPLYSLANEDPESGEASEKIAVPPELVDDVMYAISTRDDAMAPTIEFGETAWVLNRKPCSGDTVLVRFNGNLYVRKYMRERRSDWLLATNEAYMPIRITPSDVLRVLGVVMDPDSTEKAIEARRQGDPDPIGKQHVGEELD